MRHVGAAFIFPLRIRLPKINGGALCQVDCPRRLGECCRPIWSIGPQPHPITPEQADYQKRQLDKRETLGLSSAICRMKGAFALTRPDLCSFPIKVEGSSESESPGSLRPRHAPKCKLQYSTPSVAVTVTPENERPKENRDPGWLAG